MTAVHSPLDFSVFLYVTPGATQHSQEPGEHLQHKRQMPGQHDDQHREKLERKMLQDWSVMAAASTQMYGQYPECTVKKKSGFVF